MSFDTIYPNRKDWRKPHRRSKRFDRTCRNTGAAATAATNGGTATIGGIRCCYRRSGGS